MIIRQDTGTFNLQGTIYITMLLYYIHIAGLNSH